MRSPSEPIASSARGEASPPYWRYNGAERQLYLSAFHISPLTVSDYVHALNLFRPDYLVGYASSHFYLAQLVLERHLTVHRPRAVLTSSESLTGEMRAAISAAYRCDVFDPRLKIKLISQKRKVQKWKSRQPVEILDCVFRLFPEARVRAVNHYR